MEVRSKRMTVTETTMSKVMPTAKVESEGDGDGNSECGGAGECERGSGTDKERKR